MQWCFTDLIATDATAEVAIKSVKDQVQRCRELFVYSFTKLFLVIMNRQTPQKSLTKMRAEVEYSSMAR